MIYIYFEANRPTYVGRGFKKNKLLHNQKCKENALSSYAYWSWIKQRKD